MPARKTKHVSQPWREKIRTSMLVNRLQSMIEGKIKMEPHQVTAALGLLKKTAPDLQSVAMGQDPDLEPVQHIIRPQISREDWLRLHLLK